MDKTSRLGLPLIMPSQAQKHVTANEAFARLDGVVQMRLTDSDVAQAPVQTADGSMYGVAATPEGEWTGHGGELAIRSNGGWMFMRPARGWIAWDDSAQTNVVFDGSIWLKDVAAFSPGGAATVQRVIQFDQVLAAASTVMSDVSVPKGAQVVGVTGRVISAIVGPGLSGWRVGVDGAPDRYGAGLGLMKNSYLVGLSGTPVTYYEETPLMISGEGASFQGGSVRICMHLTELTPPSEAE